MIYVPNSEAEVLKRLDIRWPGIQDVAKFSPPIIFPLSNKFWSAVDTRLRKFEEVIKPSQGEREEKLHDLFRVAVQNQTNKFHKKVKKKKKKEKRKQQKKKRKHCPI